ncbi:hypothetical protein R7O12_10765 [Vibrio sp. Vb1574]|uniref:hypothetical protein n=1 Tax=Vibrio TaxID=662 RepID=UPI00215E4910|nr:MULTISPECIES: hypothetical protein [Vibrio]MCS0433750.1 hypothetical protein [Vibrio diabolicus]MDW1889694.1 hypothetical protein [Vibrio sp. Vb1574]
MKKNMSDERITKIEDLMGSPFPLEVTDYEEKIRRNLLFASMIVFGTTYLKLIPTPDSKFFGLSFENLTVDSVYIILLLVVVYELLHYIWLVSNKLMYWRVRLTGTTPKASRGNSGMRFGSQFDSFDHGGKQEDSTFYVWMLEQRFSLDEEFERHNSIWINLEDKAFSSEHLKSNDVQEILRKLNEVKSSQDKLYSHLNNLRIDASMHYFDSWFSKMLISQSVRWLILDFILPILSGVLAIGFLAYRLDWLPIN